MRTSATAACPGSREALSLEASSPTLCITPKPPANPPNRVYWRDVTASEVRQQQRVTTGLREAASLAKALPTQATHQETSDSDAAPAPREARPSAPMLLNTLLSAAVESHLQGKLDERIANEWEVVDGDSQLLDEYVLL
jgi:hypothetical protein